MGVRHKDVVQIIKQDGSLDTLKSIRLSSKKIDSTFMMNGFVLVNYGSEIDIEADHYYEIYNKEGQILYK